MIERAWSLSEVPIAGLILARRLIGIGTCSALGLLLLVSGAPGCASRGASTFLDTVPPVRYPASIAGVQDARGRFREIYCGVNEQVGSRYPDYRTCSDALTQLSGEPPATGRPVRRPSPRDTTLVFIPGMFGECVRHLATPFSDSYDALRAAGYQVVVVPAEGRSSSALNAQITDLTLQVEVRPGNRIIVFGYSKGATDFLESIQRYPNAGWTSRTRAFVAVAGVVSGTPIADDLAQLYDGLLSKLGVSSCGPGDRGAVVSQTRRQRLAWLAANPLPASIKYFSMVALPASAPMSPLLAPFGARLDQFDTNHDGMVLMEEAILPGSHLLGYANADHWAIALPFGRSTSPEAIPFAVGNSFPREVLLWSMLSYVDEVLNHGE